mgnify:CR=1 FL=1
MVLRTKMARSGDLLAMCALCGLFLTIVSGFVMDKNRAVHVNTLTSEVVNTGLINFDDGTNGMRKFYVIY